MKFWRYEFEGMKYPHTGFICGLKEITDHDTGLELIQQFEDELDWPPLNIDYPENTYVFFTEKGNKYFRESIYNIIKFANSKGVNTTIYCRKFDVDDPSIIWKDQYQAMICTDLDN